MRVAALLCLVLSCAFAAEPPRRIGCCSYGHSMAFDGIAVVSINALKLTTAPVSYGFPGADECRILFSCETARGKFIRICGDQSEADDAKWTNIEYRFGPQDGPPELTVSSGLFFSHEESKGDYRVTIRFTSGAYTYRVYSGSKSGAGVLVSDAKGKRVTDVECAEAPEVFPEYLRLSLPCDLLNPHGAAACRRQPFRIK